MKEKKQIIFFEPWPEVMIYKMSKLFREKGYKTYSIRVLESKELEDFYKEASDEVISFNLSYFKINLKNIPSIFLSVVKKLRYFFKAVFSILKLNPYVIIVRAKPSLPCALMRIIFRKTPLIYFPYDIRSESSSSREHAKQGGLSDLEINSEKFCFEKADGIIHKGAPDELNFLEGRIFQKINFTPLQMMFLPYCTKEFIIPINKEKLSKKDNEIHIVQVSSVGSANLEECSFLFDYFKAITNQKMHLHLYTKPNTLSKEEIINSFKEVYGEIMDPKYFHLHDPQDPKTLIKEISKFDFGIVIPNPKAQCKDELEARSSIGNKTSAYLEAGLPFFYPDNLKFQDSVMKEYGLSLNVNGVSDVQNMKKKIKKINYHELEDRIILAREDFLMEKHFPELEEFIRKVVNKKMVALKKL